MELKKKLCKIIFLFFSFILSLNILCESYDDLHLTEEEISWLKRNPKITAGIMNNWAPMDYIDEAGNPQGIGVDFVNLLNKKLDNRVKIVSGPWHEIYEKAKNHEIDILMDITDKEYRREFFNFTKPYVNIPHVIVVRKGSIYHKDIKSFKGRILAAEKNYGIVKYIHDNFPEIKVKEYTSTSDALNAVSNKRADFYIGNRAVANFKIRNELIFNLELQAKVDITSSINSIGVRKDWPVLASILDKALASITHKEKQDVFRKWGGVDRQQSYQLFLTETEKKWIKNNKVVIAFDEDYAPYSFKNEGDVYKGIAVDFFNEISNRTGLKYDIYKDGNWDKLYKSALNNKVDVIATIVKRPERDEFFLYSKPYLSQAQYIIVQKDNNEIKNRNDIFDKKVSLVKNYSTTKNVLNEFKDIVPVYKNNITSAISSVSSGEAEVTIASMGTAQYIISRSGFQNLKFAALYSQGQTEERFGTRNNLPVLNSIINKALNSIDEKTRMQIFQNWTPIEVAKIEAVLQRNVIIDLTEEERKWLKENKKIRIASGPVWPPVEFIDTDGNYSGISHDFLNLVGVSLNIEFEKVKVKSWSECIRLLENKEIDLLTGVAKTDERIKKMNFSSPYLELKNVIFTSQKISFIPNLENLNGRTVGVLKSSAISEYLKNDYPEIILVEVDDALKGINLLSTGQTYAYIDTLLTTTHLLQEYGYSNIKVSGDTPYVYKICMATRKDWVVLKGLIEKALNAIEQSERNKIYNKWWSIRVEKGFNYSLLWKIMPPIIVLIILISIWAIKLKSEVEKRKKAEIKMQSAIQKAKKANKAKSEFLANMSHEIRTPMNVILGYTQLLQQDESLSNSQKQSINSISKSGEHLLRLINDVLDMSKIEAGKVQIVPNVFDFYNLLHNVSDMFEIKMQKKKINYKLIITKDVPKFIEADENRIRQILINLIANAVKFTDKGEIILKTDGNGNKIFISLSDTGCGIEEDELDIIFTVFEQVGTKRRQTEGTGLGLAISRNIARLMKGDITAKSNKSEGSTFYFDFVFKPANEQKGKKVENKKIVESLASGQRDVRILIVDDKKENRDVLKSILSPIGFEIKEAENGFIAIELAKSWNPHLILLDIVMPQMDGREVTKILKNNENTKDICIIAVSASALDSERYDILKLGVNAFLKKPVNINELLSEMKNYLKINYTFREVDDNNINRNLMDIRNYDLSKITNNLKIDILKAAKIGDLDLLKELISEARLKDANFAEYLDYLVDEIELEEIINIFDELE